MKLTKAQISLLKKYPPYSQDGKGKNAKVLLKIFGGSSYTFLVTEAEFMDDGDILLIGYATIGYGYEFGQTYFSEIQNMKFLPFNLPAEIDRWLPKNATVDELVEDDWI